MLPLINFRHRQAFAVIE